MAKLDYNVLFICNCKTMTMFKIIEGIVKKCLTEKIITSSKLVLIYQTPLYFMKLG